MVHISEQKRIYEKHAVQALTRLQAMLSYRQDELIELGWQRASTLGAKEYGSRSYSHDKNQLAQEVYEELADAIFYMNILVAKDHGWSPVKPQHEGVHA